MNTMNTSRYPATPTATPSTCRGAALPRWLIGLLAVIVVLAVGAVVGLKLATDKLKTSIEAALGPNAEVASIEAGFSSIAITGIRIHADKGWPAEDELRAKRVVVKPDWNALMARDIRIAAIEIEDGYLSLLRRHDGKLVLLPSLLGKAAKSAPAPTPAPAPAAKEKGAAPGDEESPMPDITIDRIVLDNAAVDFFDASVRKPAHQLRLEKTKVELGTIRLPALTGHTRIDLAGTVKGVQRDGKVSINGWAEIASKDSEVQANLAGVDLVAFQPYLIKAAETGVRKGSLDLDLKSTVKKNRLHAPGKVVLSGLELTGGKTFMGMPREAVVSMMKDKRDRISVDFVLNGNINDPKFSLNDTFLTQVGTSTASALGISLEGLASGIGSAGSSAASGIGSALGKLFGDKK